VAVTFYNRYRLLLLNPYAAKYFSSSVATSDIIAMVASAVERGARGDPSGTPAATRIMALRFFVNCFRPPDMRPLIFAVSYAERLR
jgi:hypothetical protein